MYYQGRNWLIRLYSLSKPLDAITQVAPQVAQFFCAEEYYHDQQGNNSVPNTQTTHNNSSKLVTQ